MPVVTPQPKGLVPPDHAARILAAKTAAADADEAFKTAIADALKAGGSVREVAKVSGLSTRTVREWGTARGWPTKAQHEARAATRKKHADWRAIIDEGMKELGDDGVSD